MKHSYIANEIENEYKLKKAYEKAKRQKCEEKECINYQYNRICENKEIEDEVISVDTLL